MILGLAAFLLVVMSGSNYLRLIGIRWFYHLRNKVTSFLQLEQFASSSHSP
jgi:hypothetical protein